MPRYISKGGEWHPAKEKVGLTNITKTTKEVDGKEIAPGEPYVYEGPDRAALFELHKEKVNKFGKNFRSDPDFIARVRQLGFDSIDKYLKAIGYDEEKVDADFKKKASTVTKHELPKKVEAIKSLGGGQDSSGQGNDKYGGFGKPVA